MQVILGKVTLDCVCVRGSANLLHQMPDMDCHFAIENGLATTRDLHEAECNVNRARGLAAVFGNTILLLSSLSKRDGFSLISGRRQRAEAPVVYRHNSKEEKNGRGQNRKGEAMG